MEKPPHVEAFFLPIALLCQNYTKSKKIIAFRWKKYKIERIFAYFLTRLRNKEKRNKNGKIR